MFQFLFKYPSPVFIKGHFVFLGSWPAWLLPLFILFACGGLALLVYRSLRNAVPNLRRGRAWAIWGAQSALLALLLALLWRPAMVVSELSSQQNVIAIVIDDSREHAYRGRGRPNPRSSRRSQHSTRRAAGLERRFQTRIYKIGAGLSRADQPRSVTPVETGNAP